jgi:hypothetical protein
MERFDWLLNLVVLNAQESGKLGVGCLVGRRVRGESLGVRSKIAQFLLCSLILL